MGVDGVCIVARFPVLPDDMGHFMLDLVDHVREGEHLPPHDKFLSASNLRRVVRVLIGVDERWPVQ